MCVNNRNARLCDRIRLKFWLKDLISTKKIRKYICFSNIFLLLRQWTEKEQTAYFTELLTSDRQCGDQNILYYV